MSKKVECFICHSIFYGKKDLFKHLKVIHNVDQKDTYIKLYNKYPKCPICQNDVAFNYKSLRPKKYCQYHIRRVSSVLCIQHYLIHGISKKEAEKIINERQRKNCQQYKI